MTDTPALPTTSTLTGEQHDEALRIVAEFVATFTDLIQAVAPAFQTLAQQFAAIQPHLQQLGLLDAEGKPVQAVDRPAWQSPYGPPARRH